MVNIDAIDTCIFNGYLHVYDHRCCCLTAVLNAALFTGSANTSMAHFLQIVFKGGLSLDDKYNHCGNLSPPKALTYHLQGGHNVIGHTLSS